MSFVQCVIEMLELLVTSISGETVAANGKSPKNADTQPPTDEPIPPSLPIVPGPQKIDQKPSEGNPEKLPAVNASPAITGFEPSPAQPSPAELPNGEDSATKLRQHVKNIQQAINVGKELREAVKYGM